MVGSGSLKVPVSYNWYGGSAVDNAANSSAMDKARVTMVSPDGVVVVEVTAARRLQKEATSSDIFSAGKDGSPDAPLRGHVVPLIIG